MKADKLSNVEALRGLASLAVAWFHLTNQYAWNPVRWSGTYGYLGVDCFFVISGFIIPYSLHRAGYTIGGFPRFMARRLVRLEPPYLVAIALTIALAYLSARVPGFAGPAPHYTAPEVLSHLLYLVPAFHQQWINPVFWTLAYEFVFYIATGLLFPLLFRRRLWLTVAAVALAAFLTPGKTNLLQPLVLLFLIGIAAMRYYVRRDTAPMFLACAGAAAAVMAIEGQPAAAAVGLVTALVLAFVRMSERRPLVFLGTISYSLYLTHVPIGGRVVNLGRRFGEGAAFDLALSLAALAVCLIFAWVFYKLIEAPATVLARRLSLRGRPTQQPVTGEAPDAA